MMKLNVIDHDPLQLNVADKPAITDDTVGESVDSFVQSTYALSENTNLDEVRHDTNVLLSESKPEFENPKLLEREPELLDHVMRYSALLCVVRYYALLCVIMRYCTLLRVIVRYYALLCVICVNLHKINVDLVQII